MKGTAHGAYWLVLFTVCALTAAYAYVRNLPQRYGEYQDRKDQVHALEQHVQTLEQNKETLEDRARQLGTDPIEMEAAIRRNKKLIRPGEKVYRIEELPNSAIAEGANP